MCGCMCACNLVCVRRNSSNSTSLRLLPAGSVIVGCPQVFGALPTAKAFASMSTREEKSVNVMLPTPIAAGASPMYFNFDDVHSK